MPILYALIAGSSTLLGLALAVYAKKWVKKYSFYIVSLAAGVLLGTAFFHILPEATHALEEEVFLWVLIGFVLFYVIETVVGFHACREGDEHEHHHVFGPVAAMGIFLHSLLDGVAIAIGYVINPQLGLITALAVLIHELPEGIFTFSILLHGGMKKKRAILWSVAVALATPLGAILTLLFFPELHEGALSHLLAIAAGSFLYIAASDLIPESHKSRSLKVGLFMVLGLVLMYFLVGTETGHSH